ncbi:MAG: peptidase S41, partial [Parabacteroides sp.]|nr:peptidase S41 [Parabacteroides sp.]
FDRSKEQIMDLLASEIVKRYYYQSGELIQNLKKDPVLEKAIEVLQNRELYQQTLSKPEEGTPAATKEQPGA